MKAVKLLLSFIFIFFLVVGALYLTGAMGGDDSSKVKDPETFNKLSASLDEKWNSIDWNSELYDDFLIDIQQNERKLGSEGMNTLIDKLNEKAIPKLHAAMIGEFAKEDCDNQIIQDYKKYLDKLLETGRTDNDNLKEMSNTYTIYQKAIAFCSKSVVFNSGDGTTWTPLKAQKQNYISTRNNIKSDPYYKNIKNIKRIADFMNNLDAKMNAASSGFANAVAHKIYNKYKNGGGNFLDVYAKYCKEFGKNSLLDGLSEMYI